MFSALRSSTSLVVPHLRSKSTLGSRAIQALKGSMKNSIVEIDPVDKINMINKKTAPTTPPKPAEATPPPSENKQNAAAMSLSSIESVPAAPTPVVVVPVAADVAMNTKSTLDAAVAFVPKVDFQSFAPRICVIGVGGAGGNAVNNMISRSMTGVEFITINSDAQHLSTTLTPNQIQIGSTITRGLGCGANPDAGRAAALESQDQIQEQIGDAHMAFITAGMGGGTGTGAASVVAGICQQMDILTVGVVTLPFRFEGRHRMRLAEEGVANLQTAVDTMIIIPNQNLFKLVTPQTPLIDSFALADDVLLAGVRSITDLMTNPGLINLDFADVQSVMRGMGTAMLGTGTASGEDRAKVAAEQALSNPLLGNDGAIKTAKGMIVNICGGADLTLFEVDEAAGRLMDGIEDENANIIFGSAYDSSLEGSIRVSLVATGIEAE